jgi:hypothetical protein
MFILRHVGQDKFNTYRVSKNRIVEVSSNGALGGKVEKE